MKRFLRQLIIAIACFGPVLLMGLGAALMSRTAHAQGIRLTVDPRAEVRYCGPPARDADGTIHRSSAVIYAFRQIHPCPATGLTTGACPGWSMDHEISLACGGCDSVSNLHWMPNVIKSGPGIFPKDRWELKVYCPGRPPVSMPASGVLRLDTPASAVSQ